MKHIEEDISYQLVQISKTHRLRVGEALSKLGLHIGQDLILIHLSEKDGLPQSQLAEAVYNDISTITKAVQRMEKAGVVERRQDAEDARISRVYLTAHGRELCKPVLHIWKTMDANLLQGLNVTEQLLLRRLLLHMHANLATNDLTSQ